MAQKSRPSSGSTTDGGTPADVAAGAQSPRRSEGPRVRPTNGLDRYFSSSERGSTVKQEVRGGAATFFTMAYIVVLNPLIIGTVTDADGHASSAFPWAEVGLTALHAHAATAGLTARQSWTDGGRHFCELIA